MLWKPSHVQCHRECQATNADSKHTTPSLTQAAVCALAGAAAGSSYMAWLCADVDNVKATDRVALWEAEQVQFDALMSMLGLCSS